MNKSTKPQTVWAVRPRGASLPGECLASDNAVEARLHRTRKAAVADLRATEDGFLYPAGSLQVCRYTITMDKVEVVK